MRMLQLYKMKEVATSHKRSEPPKMSLYNIEINIISQRLSFIKCNHVQKELHLPRRYSEDVQYAIIALVARDFLYHVTSPIYAVDASAILNVDGALERSCMVLGASFPWGFREKEEFTHCDSKNVQIPPL